MTEREFLEQVELRLRTFATARIHKVQQFRAGGHHIPTDCDRCLIEKLADEAADRASRIAAR